MFLVISLLLLMPLNWFFCLFVCPFVFGMYTNLVNECTPLCVLDISSSSPIKENALGVGILKFLYQLLYYLYIILTALFYYELYA